MLAEEGALTGSRCTRACRVSFVTLGVHQLQLAKDPYTTVPFLNELLDAPRITVSTFAWQVSTRVLGKRTAPLPPFLIPYRVPYFYPRS